MDYFHRTIFDALLSLGSVIIALILLNLSQKPLILVK